MNPITDLIQMIIPSISPALATTIGYVLAFLVGMFVAIPAVGLWIRKKLPTIIAFIAYVYNEAMIAETRTKVTGKDGIAVPLAGDEKKEIVMMQVSKELLNPANNIVTKKNLTLFQKIFGIAGKIGEVIEFVVPLVNLFTKKKKKP